MNLLYSSAIVFITAFLIQYFIISFIMIDSIKNRNQPKIDCIFFPASNNEKI